MDEDFLAYVDDYDTNTWFANMPTICKSNKELAIAGDFGQRYPYCEICCMKECIMRTLFSNTNIYGI